MRLYWPTEIGLAGLFIGFVGFIGVAAALRYDLAIVDIAAVRRAQPHRGLGANDSQLAFWNFHVDWNTPANTSLIGPSVLSTAICALPCSDTGGNCASQSGSGLHLDTLGDRHDVPAGLP